MDSTIHAITVLRLLVNLGPLALYFVVLGLVNSQRHPRLISARADFITLTVAFLPVLVWPVPFLVSQGWWLWLGGGLVCAIAMFRFLLPQVNAGWVVYHITREDAIGSLRRAVRRLGWNGTWTDDDVTLPAAGLALQWTAFPWLGSVSIHVRPLDNKRIERDADRLRVELEREFQRHALLPSPIGACLVLVGVALWILPLWMTFRHLDAIVDVVENVLFT